MDPKICHDSNRLVLVLAMVAMHLQLNQKYLENFALTGKSSLLTIDDITCMFNSDMGDFGKC